MMDEREKQIEEIARLVCPGRKGISCEECLDSSRLKECGWKTKVATDFYNAGYRMQKRSTRETMEHWIDNADSYICPKCGYECVSPARFPYYRCPICGFQDPKDAPQSGCPVCNAGHEIIIYAKTDDPKENDEYKLREVNFCPVCGKKMKGGK